MSPETLYHISAVLLVFYAVSHTFGLLGSHKPEGVPSQVRKSMDEVRFNYMGRDCTWGGFYLGFGLMVTGYLIFTAILAWEMSSLVKGGSGLGDFFMPHHSHLRTLAWAFVCIQGVNTYIAARYFFTAPTVVSGIITLLLTIAAVKI